jgi:hypothetical protein
MLAPIPTVRIEQIEDLRRSLKDTTNKMISQNQEDLIHIVKFKAPASIFIKIMRVLYLLKAKEEPSPTISYT